MATQEITVIESETREGQYDMTWTAAIIEHPQHGRLYLAEGFGGMDSIEGGMYRWQHGLACRVLPSDTLESLEDDCNDYSTIREAMTSGHDDSRPVLEWSGSMIAAVAQAAGL